MAIPDHVRANFPTLLRAAAAGDLALIECTDVKSANHATCSAPSPPRSTIRRATAA
jgi:hypothetical protein